MLHSLFLILISAVLYGLSFPPFSFSLLMWGALVPFFIVASRVPPRSAAAYGVLWGMIMTCSFGWSFPQLVANYFGLSLLSGWGLLMVVSLVLFGVYFGVFALWLSWCSQRWPLSPWLVAAGWGVCEFARATLWVGNPLALAGYSQVALPHVVQIADISGPYGIGFLIAAVNAGLASCLAPRLRGQYWGLSWLGITGALTFTLVYGTWRLSQTFTGGEPIRVAIIQGAIPRELRWKPEHWDANLAQYLDLSRQAAETKPALIFWPENAVDFPLQRDSVRQKAVLQASQDFGADLILGGPYFRVALMISTIAMPCLLCATESSEVAMTNCGYYPLPTRLVWLVSSSNLVLYEPGQHLHTSGRLSHELVLLCVLRHCILISCVILLSMGQRF